MILCHQSFQRLYHGAGTNANERHNDCPDKIDNPIKKRMSKDLDKTGKPSKKPKRKELDKTDEHAKKPKS